MRSTEIRARARGQRGASLIEAVVASALMGIGVVGGLTAWDTAAAAANRSVRIAWANCIVRSEMDAILAAPYQSSYDPPQQFQDDGTMRVQVNGWQGRNEEIVTVTAFDPASGAQLATVSALKAPVVAGSKLIDDPSSATTFDVFMGCPQQ
jgi:Tfp pilus assembly protein PilV